MQGAFQDPPKAGELAGDAPGTMKQGVEVVETDPCRKSKNDEQTACLPPFAFG